MQRGSWHSLTMQALVNKGGGGDAPKRNQIWYWAASQVTLYTTDNVVSHTFADGKGVVTFDSAVSSVAQWFRATPITGVQLPDKTRTVSTNAFYQCTSLTNAIMPDTIREVNGNAFWNAKITNSVLPTSLRLAGANGFRNCPMTLAELPPNIETIANSAFYNCYYITITEIPASVASIGTLAFQSCRGITDLTFLGTPTSIGATAFQGCANLATIRVPWAEGAVANAPWGATNATIIYNYTPGGQGGFNLTTAVSELGLSGDWLPNGATTTYNGTEYPVYQHGSYYLAMRADGKPHINRNADVSGTSLWRPYVYTQGAEMTASNLSGEWNNPNDDWDATFTFTELS